MNTCRWFDRVEASFDGEEVRAPGIQAHLAACPRCAAYLDKLKTLRKGVHAAAHNEFIADEQFTHFMEGIRQGIAEPAPRHHMGFWTALSLTAAALLIALATFSILQAGPAKVKATEVESVSTDLAGATVDWYDSKNGITTVWVNESKDDIE